MKKKPIKMSDWILLYLYKLHPNESVKLPSVRFWGITLLCVGAGIKIKAKKSGFRIKQHILTVKDCFIEMNDLLEEGLK